jgi:hypothetical protein
MVFILMTGGKSKQLKGKFGGDKFGAHERDRAEVRRYDRECKLTAERKSSRRAARFEDFETDPVFVTDRSPVSVRKPKSRESFVTDDGNTRVTLRYNAAGICVSAYVRPTYYR